MSAMGWTLYGLAAVGQASSGAAEAGAEAAQVHSIWDFVLKGGPMMVPLTLCSLVALAVFVERLFTLSRRKVIPPAFIPGLRKLLDDKPASRKKALAYCEGHTSPIAKVFAAGVKRLGAPLSTLEKHFQEAGQRAVRGLRKNVRVLSVIASIAPLMGLLGTIFGMINAFQTVASSAEALGKTELLAKGIYQALITTAAGLLVAIPVVIGYHLISSRIDRLVVEMDQMAVDFIDRYADPHTQEAEEARGPRAVSEEQDENGVDDSADEDSVEAAVA